MTQEVFEQVQDISKTADEVEGSLASGQFGEAGGGEIDLDLPTAQDSQVSSEGESADPFLQGDDLDVAPDDDDDDASETDEHQGGLKP